tara:strand:- start:34745 stop:35032 length:288 start_codon:yes stop_codon:yes gene_type:complete
MPYLKLHRDEPETQAPQPLPFDQDARNWSRAGRDAGSDQTDREGDEQMDSIAQVEQALSRVENAFVSLSEQVDEICEPISMADWIDDHDDGPYAA